PTTAPAAITARTAVRRSDVSNAPIMIVSAPATTTVELAIAVMYERCGGIQNASVTAASPPPARTTNAPASAIGEPVASAMNNAAMTTSYREMAHCSGSASETAAVYTIVRSDATRMTWLQ